MVSENSLINPINSFDHNYYSASHKNNVNNEIWIEYNIMSNPYHTEEMIVNDLISRFSSIKEKCRTGDFLNYEELGYVD